MHLTLEEFARAHRALTEEDFLRRVTVPHLLVRYLPNPSPSVHDTFRTVRVQAAPAAAPRGDRLVLPVAKRPFANVFATMVTVGRAPNNDLVLSDPRVSKLQAYFSARGGAWQLWDPVSTNGTVVDGARVPRAAGRSLRSTARIELSGAAECLFVLPRELYLLVVAPAASARA